MKIYFALSCLFILTLQFVSAQENPYNCWCDTSFNALKEGTTRQDSINWTRIKCFYAEKRGKMDPKSIVNYHNGQREGDYVSYYPRKEWIFVRQRGYQQAVPRKLRRVRDFYRREGKSLFGKSEVGTYIKGKKNGVWYSMDTNQRIMSKASWSNGFVNTEGRICQGLYDITNVLYRSEFDSIETLISTFEDGTHDYIQSENKIISFQIKDHQLNGEFIIYKKAKSRYIYSTHQFSDNCLIDSSVNFSIKGDTTRIETNFKRGIPYKIVSYTPSSRGTTYYRAPVYSYELNSDYRNGLIVRSRKSNLIKKP